jgi:hypothetical protein
MKDTVKQRQEQERQEKKKEEETYERQTKIDNWKAKRI